jgi:hypothetical protein
LFSGKREAVTDARGASYTLLKQSDLSNTLPASSACILGGDNKGNLDTKENGKEDHIKEEKMRICESVR